MNRPMVKSPLLIYVRGYMILIQQAGYPVCKFGTSWGWIGDFIRCIRKTIIIVKHLGGWKSRTL